jgi:hypothetical protein
VEKICRHAKPSVSAAHWRKAREYSPDGKRHHERKMQRTIQTKFGHGI